MRTYVSLYSFGFSISKFADFLEQQDQEMVVGLQRMGLALILMGIVGLYPGIARAHPKGVDDATSRTA